MASTTPPWPSLYNPSIEILHIEHRNPVQPGAAYLSRAKDVFLFTFYWTLIFYTPLFLFSGAYAFFTLTLRSRPSSSHNFPADEPTEHEIDQAQLSPPPFPSSPTSSPRNNTYSYLPLQFLQSPRSWTTTPRNNSSTLVPPAQKKNERRSRITYALLVLFIFLVVGLAGAVVNSAILGFVVLGLYRAGHFHMSTWIPFLLAILQVSVGLLSIWPSTIEII